MNIRNVSLTVFFCFILLGPIGLFFTQNVLNLPLPSWLSAEDAKYIEGNNNAVSIAEHISLADAVEGQLQSSFESEIANYIPARAMAIVSNAAWQRKLISCSNSLFGWECFPSYYGSSRIVIPEFNAVSYIPTSASEEMVESWTSFAKGIKHVAALYPEKRFVLYVIQGYSEPSWNPAYGLISYSSNPALCQETMSSILSDSENVWILTKQYSSGEEYYEHFFTTDHHWNIRGAWAACDQICSVLDIESPPQTDYESILGYTYTGATARSAIDMIEEGVFDSTTSFEKLELLSPTGTATNGNDHASFWDLPPLRQHFNFYDSYYNTLGLGTIKGGSGTHTGLLIGNSYIGALQRPLASAFQTLSVRRDLHPSFPPEETLVNIIETSDAEDIIFVANPGNYAVISDYFE